MLCDAQPDLEVVGEAGQRPRRRSRWPPGSLPDVVVMDLRMPGVDGITATGRILAERPATRVLVLTTFGDDDHLYPALTAGACGFLLKDAPPDRAAGRHPPGRGRGQPVQPGGAAAAGPAGGARPGRRAAGRRRA